MFKAHEESVTKKAVNTHYEIEKKEDANWASNRNCKTDQSQTQDYTSGGYANESNYNK